ncbi:MAG: hypothetical protein D6730_25200 [Bacteroidetes bacterium]|nr:MAG: hypothetical protein D6730_25200 [Bacteroidota bacterium]
MKRKATHNYHAKLETFLINWVLDAKNNHQLNVNLNLGCPKNAAFAEIHKLSFLLDKSLNLLLKAPVPILSWEVSCKQEESLLCVALSVQFPQRKRRFFRKRSTQKPASDWVIDIYSILKSVVLAVEGDVLCKQSPTGLSIQFFLPVHAHRPLASFASGQVVNGHSERVLLANQP